MKQAMDERLQFISHKGKNVLLCDFSGCTTHEMMRLLNLIRAEVAEHPRNSLLTLADYTGAHIDREVAARMKEVLVFDRPYVKRSAMVGAQSLPKVIHENITSFSQREIPAFATREEAIDWLVKD